MTAFVQVLEVLRYNTQFESHKVLVGYSNTTIAADICLPFPPGLHELKHFPGGPGYHVLVRKGEADQPILTVVGFLLSLSNPETYWEGETFHVTGSFHPNSIRFSVGMDERDEEGHPEMKEESHTILRVVDQGCVGITLRPLPELERSNPGGMTPPFMSFLGQVDTQLQLVANVGDCITAPQLRAMAFIKFTTIISHQTPPGGVAGSKPVNQTYEGHFLLLLPIYHSRLAGWAVDQYKNAGASSPFQQHGKHVAGTGTMVGFLDKRHIKANPLQPIESWREFPVVVVYDSTQLKWLTPENVRPPSNPPPSPVTTPGSKAKARLAERRLKQQEQGKGLPSATEVDLGPQTPPTRPFHSNAGFSAGKEQTENPNAGLGMDKNDDVVVVVDREEGHDASSHRTMPPDQADEITAKHPQTVDNLEDMEGEGSPSKRAKIAAAKKPATLRRTQPRGGKADL